MDYPAQGSKKRMYSEKMSHKIGAFVKENRGNCEM